MKLPSIQNYADSLLKCESEIRERLEILFAHYYSPKHTATMTELANLVGYPNHNAVNLQYGLLAHTLCEAMGVTKKQLGGEDVPWLHILVRFEKPHGGDWELCLHDQVVKALEQLDWVKHE